MYYNNGIYSNYTQTTRDSGKVISDEVKCIVDIIMTTFLGSGLCLFGSFTNIINISVFIRQGFSESINVTLLGLAMSDLGGLIFLLWSDICGNPWLIGSGKLPFVPGQIQLITAGIPRLYFSKVTCWLTIFVILQRCLCISYPLRVHILVTPYRTLLLLCFVYIAVFMLIVFPATCTGSVYTAWLFYPSRNDTLLSLEFHDKSAYIFPISAYINIVFQLASFGTILISTCVLVAQLNRRMKWRKSTANMCTESGQSFKQRDQRLSLLIVTLSAILIACYIPSAALIFCGFCIEEFGANQAQSNFYFMAWSLAFLSESFHSSLNIFIYQRMSTKYRITLNEMFSLLQKRKQEPSCNVDNFTVKSSVKWSNTRVS